MSVEDIAAMKEYLTEQRPTSPENSIFKMNQVFN